MHREKLGVSITCVVNSLKKYSYFYNMPQTLHSISQTSNNNIRECQLKYFFRTECHRITAQAEVFFPATLRHTAPKQCKHSLPRKSRFIAHINHAPRCDTHRSRSQNMISSPSAEPKPEI